MANTAVETQGQKQRRFVRYLGLLINFAYANGYEITLGRGLETPAGNKANGGKATSNHLNGLAQDLNIFKGGVWLNKSGQYDDLGAYWKSLSPDCCWGQDFPADSNHFSLEYNHMK